MAAQNQGAPNMDQFDAFFRRADLDGDGRISGPEAVTFFQGSNLPKNVLAQIWTYADQRKAGFLGRPEFCNALRLITVAQSKRELTPDIVKAALFGPAAAKIPPPQINLPAAPVAPASAPQTRPVAPAASQHFGYSERGVPNASMNQHNFPSHPNQSMRPPQALPTGFPLKPPQGIDASELPRGGNVVGSSAPNLNSSSNWLGGTGAVNTGPRGISTSVSTPQAPVLTSSQTLSSDSKALASSGNGFPSNSSFEGDVFSASTPPQKQEPFGLLYAPSGGAASSAVVPVSSGPQSSNKISSLDSFSAFSIQASGGPSVRGQSSLSPSQQVPLPNSSSLISSGATTGSGNSTADNLQLTWPKMKPTDVQKYTKVFREVDTDRDGKITGEQARNLFLSWRLPREVLKQVWDLSDQDTDSMLSLREFCFALYLMERYREGCLLPAALPSNVMFDETLLSLTGQPNVSYGNAAWGPNAGFGQQQGVTSGQTTASATGPRPLLPRSVPRADGVTQSNQQKSGAPLLKDSFLNLSGNGQQSSISTESIEPTASEKKVGETENVYLDSKEKMEFYRTMMQELVLYKSRCDNRLNEITARASADKNEAESLMKKYEERYKQVADIASKLTIEEARFRDIQERKTELQQAIIKIDQGGSADGILQVRADRIQSDLEDLMKALNDRSRKHGLEVKSAAMVELPTGWQPGIPEQAALWDEDWDKFEDEGFANDLVIDVHKENSTTVPNENGSIDFDATSDSPSQVNGKIVNSSSAGGHGLESDSAYTHSEDESARSPRDSPAGGTTMDSPFQDSSDPHYKQSEADAETHRSFDYSTWGAFDNNDDVDSVWGFNAVNSKDFSAEKHGDFFGSDDFGVKPIKTGSPHSDNVFQRKSPFFDSVPSTPASRFGNSPTRLSEVSGDHFFDNFSRFDSFNTRDGGYSPKHSRFDSMSSSKDFGLNSEKFSRLDSMQSTADFGQTSQKLTRFDSMSSTADFGQDSQRLTRFDSMSSATDFGQNSERLTRFDSTSTRDFGNIGPFSSFDDGDPFGSSGPFKVSSENQAAKKDSDNWRAF